MEKISEIIQTLIWSCQFLSLEKSQSEIDEIKEGHQFKFCFTSTTVYVDTGNFLQLIKLFLLVKVSGDMVSMTFCK